MFIWLTKKKRDITVLISTADNAIESLVGRFSSLSKLIGATAYIFRFIRKIRPEEKWLSVEERKNALIFWVKKTQNIAFNDEIHLITSNGNISAKSRLKSLSPYIDSDGLLRVGGRLKHANIDVNATHQMILPSKGKLIVLIINDIHGKTLHGGGQVMLAYLRQQFWMLDARNTIRPQIHKCVTCQRHRANTASQLMGQLPSYRVQQSLPFRHTGVDYAGPMDVRRNKERGSATYKGYISVFVCMSTKAIHLEIVTDLSTDGFLAAFRRFTARRGICSHVYSDCGTNFVGAAKQLKQDLNKSKLEKEAAESLARNGTQWHFNPPSAPHFGGIWEAGVKSTKSHLNKILKTSCLTYEELSTLLSQIEAVLNSRPLCQMTNDPSDLEVLTPGHFLVGRPLTTVPEPSYIDISEHRLSRWQRIQQLNQSFWKRWHNEYIHQLQQRYKWTSTKNNVNINDMVLIKDDRLPPAQWRLGRIINVHAGKDDLVRVVTVRTQMGAIDRPIAKLCILPIKNPIAHATNKN